MIMLIIGVIVSILVVTVIFAVPLLIVAALIKYLRRS